MGFMFRIKEMEKENRYLVMRYALVFFTSVFIHLFWLVLFLILGHPVLAVLNGISVLLYLAGAQSFSVRKIGVVGLLLLYGDVVVHASVCNLVMGWRYGFSLYGLMIIPVTYYLSSQHDGIAHPAMGSGVLTAVDVLLMAGTVWYSHAHGDAGSGWEAAIIFSLNLFLCAAALASYAKQFLVDVKSAERQLLYEAKYDSLTGLRNRHDIRGDVEKIEKSRESYCVVLGDIDDFKKINDTYGHHFGDIVLENIGGVFRTGISKDDIACRWGGEEFLLILRARIDITMNIVERIQKQIARLNLEAEGQQVKIHMTFGVARKGEAAGFDTLAALADERMYQGKRNGKNQIVMK